MNVGRITGVVLGLARSGVFDDEEKRRFGDESRVGDDRIWIQLEVGNLLLSKSDVRPYSWTDT